MSSSATSSGPSKRQRRTQRPPRGLQKLSLNPMDLSFNPVAQYPNLNKHLSNETAVTIQACTVTNGFFTTSSTIPTSGALGFGVSSTPSFSSMSAVFDQYKIKMIEVWLVPAPTELNVTPANPGTFTSAIDLDDATANPQTQLLGYQSAVTTGGLSAHYHRWVPHVAVAAYSGTFTSFANETSPWVDCASGSVQHYGLKYAASGSTYQVTFNIITRYTVSYRALHD